MTDMSLDIQGRPFSYTAFSTWLSCGKRFELEKLRGVQRIPAWYNVGGTVFHEWAEAYDRGEEPPPIKLMFIDAIWKTEEESGVERAHWYAGGKATKQNPDKESQAWWESNLPLMADRYVEWRKQTGWTIWEPKEGVPAIELKVEFSLGEVRVKGYIDRVFVLKSGELAITDLKTGSRQPENNLQLGTYATAIQVVYGVRPSYGYYYLARKGEHTPVVKLDDYSPAVLAEMLRLFKVAVENEIFIPNVTGKCNQCGVRHACAIAGGGEAARQHDKLASLLEVPF